jgi:hypothetical protein
LFTFKLSGTSIATNSIFFWRRNFSLAQVLLALRLSDLPLKFRTIAMIYLLNMHSIHTEFLFIVDLKPEFHMPGFSDLLVIAIELEAKYICHTAAVAVLLSVVKGALIKVVFFRRSVNIHYSMNVD